MEYVNASIAMRPPASRFWSRLRVRNDIIPTWLYSQGTSIAMKAMNAIGISTHRRILRGYACTTLTTVSIDTSIAATTAPATAEKQEPKQVVEPPAHPAIAPATVEKQVPK